MSRDRLHYPRVIKDKFPIERLTDLGIEGTGLSGAAGLLGPAGDGFLAGGRPGTLGRAGRVEDGLLVTST